MNTIELRPVGIVRLAESTWLKSGTRLFIEFVGSVDMPDWDAIPDEELFRVNGG